MLELNYIELIRIKEQYNHTDSQTIKKNIKRVMKRKGIKHQEIANILGGSMHTAYSYTNPENKGKPSIINLLLLSSFFDVSIYDLLEPYKA